MINSKKVVILIMIICLIFIMSVPAFATSYYYAWATGPNGGGGISDLFSTESAAYNFVTTNDYKGIVTYNQFTGTLYGVVLNGTIIDFSYIYVLSNGSTGAKVSAVQHALQQLGYSVTVDGIFGTETEEAILNFQQENGLTQDGIVGVNTYRELATFGQ